MPKPTIKDLQAIIEKQNAEITEKDSTIEKLRSTIIEKDEEIEGKNKKILTQENDIKNFNRERSKHNARRKALENKNAAEKAEATGTIRILRDELSTFMYKDKEWEEKTHEINDYIYILCGSK